MALTIKDAHDPDARLDYEINWGPFVDELGETQPGWLYEDDVIVSSTWKDATGGLAIDTDSHTDTHAKVWLTGGTPGETGSVTNHVTTAAGREDDRTLRIKIKEL